MSKKTQKSTSKDNKAQVKQLTQHQLNFLGALEKSLSIVSHAARATGICRDLHYKWIKESPLYAEKAAATREVVLDFLESNLFQQVKAQVPASTIFALKCLGKHRGYFEKSQIEHSGQLGINAKIDFTKLSDEQLRAIAAGSSFSDVGITEEDERD
jgi:hypothetical protein